MSKPILLRRLLVVVLSIASHGTLVEARVPSLSIASLDAPPTVHTLDDLEDIEAFVDGYIAGHLKTHDVPGVTLSVVKHGKLWFAKGYGVADLEQRRPVRADTTIFRIASVSKLFTATAVMQLVEEGELDLHADVNTYLKAFSIPRAYDKPVTLAHLLTHTSGFEDRYIETAATTAEAMQPLGAVLARNLPARIRPPGQFAAYSNHGFALAGHIVEQAAGMPFDASIEERLFKPLEMNQSTFRSERRKRYERSLSAIKWVNYRVQ